MDYILKNDKITVKVSDQGAVLKSIMDQEGTEFIWIGDKEYWAGQAPHLFPYVGRFTDGKYTLNGKTYEMVIHGFARFEEFAVEEQSETKIVLSLSDNEKLRESYPYAFKFSIIYEVEGNTLKQTYRVENKGNEKMYFAVGGHPGFNVPLEKGLAFEDYKLEFANRADAWRVGMSDTCYVNGKDETFVLEEGRSLRLKHELFDHDAIVLKHMDRTVKLCSDKGSKSVTVSYPDLPYLGIWQTPKKQPGFVCIEPWSTLPSRDGIVEEFTQKSDMLMVGPGMVYENRWDITCE